MFAHSAVLLSGSKSLLESAALLSCHSDEFSNSPIPSASALLAHSITFQVSATTASFADSRWFTRSVCLLKSNPFSRSIFGPLHSLGLEGSLRLPVSGAPLSPSRTKSSVVLPTTDSSDKEMSITLIAGIGGSVAAVAVILALVFCVRRGLAEKFRLAIVDSPSPDSDEPETGVHGHGPLHSSLLGTTDALTLTEDLGGGSVSMVQSSGATENPFWELSDD
jgi:hypothetical protein